MMYFSHRLCAVLLLSGLMAAGTPAATQANRGGLPLRKMRYQPDQGAFVITNGMHRFNRALYGSHTGFRVEAGDRPEFGLYMPRLGGTLRLGIIRGDQSRWLIDAEHIEARYGGGSMRYRISDALLGDGRLELNLRALADADGMILKMDGSGLPEDVRICWAFGGASDQRFSRDGDLGADPESAFYLKPENCRNAICFVQEQAFQIYYEPQKKIDPDSFADGYVLSRAERENQALQSRKCIAGIVPAGSSVRLVDAAHQNSPLHLLKGAPEDAPVVCGVFRLLEEQSEYLLLVNPRSCVLQEADPAQLFREAGHAIDQLAGHFKVHTPDEYINAAGAALVFAADGIWDGRSYMHGSVAWRMPLNGWRGAYAADWLGWPERAESHFRGYFQAQYTEPDAGPSVPDPETHLARQKEEAGTALFTSGYISRSPGKLNKPHHYDMNLVFISQLLWHFQWTGDTNFLHESWPVLERHLAWEKRNFDADDDGLYDAYCCIWSSDALQYSGGGVTYSSAYNYRANRMAAQLAPLVGKDPAPYEAEAEKIRQEVRAHLWLADRGWFAEYKDLLGLGRVHPSAAVWTLYHAIDEGVADPFQTWQSTQYIDQHIPRIPVRGEGVPSSGFYTIPTSDWMPYTWSINNVAMAEVLHTALAYWQAGRSREAFNLTKSSLLDFMFMGSSPGNIGQLSWYDAFRGELYRDFADPVGMTARAFVEGLFGFKPNLMEHEIQLHPGWPADWQFAELETTYLKLAFHKNGNVDYYSIENRFGKDLQLRLAVPCPDYLIGSVRVNGQVSEYTYDENAIGQPVAVVQTPLAETYRIDVAWSSAPVESLRYEEAYTVGDQLELGSHAFQILEVYDPRQVLQEQQPDADPLRRGVKGDAGPKTFFVKLRQEKATWWQAVSFLLRPQLEGAGSEDEGAFVGFNLKSHRREIREGVVTVNRWSQSVELPAHGEAFHLSIPKKELVCGTNFIDFNGSEETVRFSITDWEINRPADYEAVPIDPYFNDSVTDLFQEHYRSPRAPSPTLALPVQGIGDWCSFRETAEIDDRGIRRLADQTGRLIAPQGIPFQTPGGTGDNVLFTSQWDVYPEMVTIPLRGKASHVYMLMAGSAHHMQIHMLNGVVEVFYADGTSDVLELRSPDNWWPIEQDYYEDGLAFKLKGPRPPRLHLKSGLWSMKSGPVKAKNHTLRIEGGAASLLDLPIDPEKELKSLRLQTLSNDIVMGLMAVTLKRD